jgi:hypothetical protein
MMNLSTATPEQLRDRNNELGQAQLDLRAKFDAEREALEEAFLAARTVIRAEREAIANELHARG